MPAPALPPLLYTETEVRSYLPSGWGIVPGASGRWIPKQGLWTIEVYDGADNTWRLEVPNPSAAKDGRLPALRAAVVRLERRALGRKSVLSG
jgi:hypothetical protein